MSSFRSDLFEGHSDVTGGPYFVGDAEEMTVFLGIASETTVVLEGSNAIGFRTAIGEGEWSNLTTIVASSSSEILNIEPGFRWIRGVRESTTSWGSLVVAGRNTTRRS